MSKTGIFDTIFLISERSVLYLFDEAKKRPVHSCDGSQTQLALYRLSSPPYATETAHLPQDADCPMIRLDGGPLYRLARVYRRDEGWKSNGFKSEGLGVRSQETQRQGKEETRAKEQSAEGNGAWGKVRDGESRAQGRAKKAMGRRVLSWAGSYPAALLNRPTPCLHSFAKIQCIKSEKERNMLDEKLTELVLLAKKLCPEARIEVNTVRYEDKDGRIKVFPPPSLSEAEEEALERKLKRKMYRDLGGDRSLCSVRDLRSASSVKTLIIEIREAVVAVCRPLRPLILYCILICHASRRVRPGSQGFADFRHRSVQFPLHLLHAHG